MSKLSDDVIVDLSVTPSGNHCEGNDQKEDSQTATSISSEATRPNTSAKDKQLLPPYTAVPKNDNFKKGKNFLYSVAKYKATMSEFTGPGDYSAIWNICVPAFYRIGEGTKVTLLFTISPFSMLEVSGLWKGSGEGQFEQQEQQTRTVHFRLDAKIHVEKGYLLEASLDLQFESIDRLNGTNTATNRDDVIEVIDDSAPKPGTAFLFELKPCDPQELESGQIDPSILTLPVTRRVDVPLRLTPPSIQEDPQNTVILATAVSQDEKFVMTVSKRAHGMKIFLDLWDLSGYYSYSASKDKKHLIKSRRPAASTVFTIDGVEDLRMPDLGVTLSSNGELVAVFDESLWKNEGGGSTAKLRVRVFQHKPATTSIPGADAATEVTMVERLRSGKETSVVGLVGNQIVSPSKAFEEVKYDMLSSLSTFAGFAKFQQRSAQHSDNSMQSTDAQEFVLVTCNNHCLEVYEVGTRLMPLYTVVLAGLSRNGDVYISCRLLMETLQNSMFVWYVDADKEISVWNWLTGKNVGYFPGGSTPVLSTDESLLVVFHQSLVCTYSTKNGQLESFRTNVFWDYFDRDLHLLLRRRFNVLHQGNGRLVMHQKNRQDHGSITSLLVRYVDIHNVEDIQETTIDTPLGSSVIHVLASMTLDQQNAIGTVIVGTNLSVEVLSLEPDKTTTLDQQNATTTVPTRVGTDPVIEVVRESDKFTTTESTTAIVCGLGCSKPWRYGPKPDSHYDERQHCTFRFNLDYEMDLIRLVRIRAKSKSNGRGVTLLELPLRVLQPELDANTLNWTFLQDRNQFYVSTDSDLELWQLPTATVDRCTLLGVGDTLELLDIPYQFICIHGSFHRHDGESWASWFGTSNKELSGQKSIMAIWKKIKWYTDNFDTFPMTYKRAVAECIAGHINKDPYPNEVSASEASEAPPRTSFMWRIVRECVRSGKDALLLAVLGSNDHLGYWIPSPEEFSADSKKDMIAHLIIELKLPVIEILIDYCLTRAQSTDRKLLEKLMISVPHLIPRHPDVALNIARRAAFLPVPAKNRDQLLQEAVYNGDQWQRGRFWLPAKTKLYEVIDKSPVFHRLNRLAIFDSNETQELQNQLDLFPVAAETKKKNANIKAKLYMAPFSLVWTIQGDESRSKKLKSGRKVSTNRIIGKDQELTTMMTKPLITGNTTTSASGLTLVIRMIWHFVYPFDKVFIHSHYNDLQAYDNPAFSALMAYKWARFARYFWCLRLFFQISYEFLVLSMTLFQLYGDEEQRASLVHGYIAIVLFSSMLLHFEFKQMHRGCGRYLSSPYNCVDLCVYVIPMVSSCVLIANADHIVALRALSFSVVLIYMHFIFELRVFRNVCRVVTIVVNILSNIPAFFIILAIFILSFAHAINHLTEVNFRAVGCMPDPSDTSTPTICNAQRSEFPRGYLQSISATYFFMTGDYGPVQTSLTDGHWTIQLMVSVFFFLTAVLMMNVVIALMNGVYDETILTVDQIWLKNRMDLIAGVESLSYFIPYFRNHFDYFPKWVYYTATDKEVEEYRKRYGLDEVQRLRPVKSSEEVEVEEEVEEVEGDKDAHDEGEEVDEREYVGKEKYGSDKAATSTVTGQDVTYTILRSSSQEADSIVKALKAELSEIKDHMAVQDRRYQKVEEMLTQMLLVIQR